MGALVWQQWFYLLWVIFGVCATIWMIGRPRKALTPGDAIGQILIGLVILAIILSI